MRLKNKVALVTGAAKGIGAETARLMARNGATVFVADILTKQAILVANDINTQFENQAKAITLDVSLEDSWLNTIK